MKIECNPSSLKTVSKVAREAVLDKIYLVNGNFERAFGEDLREKLNAVVSTGSEFIERVENRFLAKVTLNFEGISQEDNKAADVKVNGQFVLEYLLPPNSAIEDNEIVTFCEINAIYNAWPFIREFLVASLTRLDLPPFLMPLLRIGRAKEKVIASEKQKGQTNLSKPKKKRIRQQKEVKSKI